MLRSYVVQRQRLVLSVWASASKHGLPGTIFPSTGGQTWAKTMATNAPKTATGICNGNQPITMHNTFLNPSCSRAEAYTLLILNYELPPFVLSLWKQAAYCICADGGANRVFDHIRATFPGETHPWAHFRPNMVLGDLDSLRPEVRQSCAAHGISVVNIDDQDSTDMAKCLNYIMAHDSCQFNGSDEHRPTVICVGAVGGRLDHTLGNLATLLRFPQLRVVLVGDGNTAQLLPAGRSRVVPIKGIEGPTCGLVPLFQPARCTSKGLRWNLNGDEMSMTGLISTSNIIEGDCVEVETDQPLLWTVEIDSTALAQAVGGVQPVS